MGRDSEKPLDRLTEKERERYQYLVDEYPDLPSTEYARRVLAYFEED